MPRTWSEAHQIRTPVLACAHKHIYQPFEPYDRTWCCEDCGKLLKDDEVPHDRENFMRGAVA